MSPLFLEGPSHASPSSADMKGGPHFHLIDWLCVCASGAAARLHRRWEPGSGVHSVEDLGGSVRQDRGCSLPDRMLPAEVRWMMLQRPVYSAVDTCHNIALLPEPLQSFATHTSPSSSICLSLCDRCMYTASCLLSFDGECWACRLCFPISLNGTSGRNDLPLSFVEGSLQNEYTGTS